MFVSLALRCMVNVEALNMVESVGNVTRHRRATLIVEVNGKYKKVEVPAVSGEMIAHGYQRALVRVANRIYEEPPVCKWCSRGEFFKEMDASHMISEAKKVEGEGEDYAHNFEKTVIKNCLVEDIGGFLKAEAPPVRRTSLFYVGYMVPVKDAIEVSNIESQFHVRQAPSEPARREGERAAQMIYYVEVGNAIYGLNFNLDLGGIGFTSLVKKELAVDSEERRRRVKVALGALLDLFCGSGFGAKRTRFLPLIETKSAIISVSNHLPFTVHPPSSKAFINDTIAKKRNLKEAYSKIGITEEIKIFAYSSEIEIDRDEDVKVVDSLEEALLELIRYVEERV